MIFPVMLFAQTLGDVNSSGTVDIVDALMIAQYYVGFSPIGFNMSPADVDCDDDIDIIDALLIARYYVGMISSLPGCNPTGTPGPATEEPPAPTAGPSVAPTDVPIGPTATPSPPLVSPPVPTPTVTPGESEGDCWLTPSYVENVQAGQDLAFSVLCNTGTRRLGSFEISIWLANQTVFTMNTEMGTNGVDSGTAGYILNVDTPDSYQVVIKGDNPLWNGPDKAIHLCTIHLIGLKTGSGYAQFNIASLKDETGANFPANRAFGANITVQ